MTDIVDTLRTTPTQRTWDSVGRAYDYPEHLPREAADEIERLRKALGALLDTTSAERQNPAIWFERVDHARILLQRA